MSESKDFVLYKQLIEPKLFVYRVEKRHFMGGDFGDLDQIEFNSIEIGGEIDFWSKGYLSIHLVNYLTGNVLLNVFLSPDEGSKKSEAFSKLSELLEDKSDE